MAETIATASAGFKTKRKPTKTKTMVQTLKEAQPTKPAKTKKVAKKAPKKARNTKPAKKAVAKKNAKKGKK